MIHKGLVLQNRYWVVQELGRGGLAETWEVEDRGTLKVLKVLRDNYPKAVELFKREAEVLKQLNHPGIPRVEPDGYFTFESEGTTEPLHCLVMEFIEGQDLEKWLEQRGNEPISQEQAIDWLKQLVEILDRVHHKDHFHRDIKPSNIMLRKNGQLVLIDFGTVRKLTDTYIAKRQRHDVTRIYSFSYTAPEQLRGQACPQSDFFALGRTFVYLLTGKPPEYFNEDPQTFQFKQSWQEGAPQVSKPVADLIDNLMEPSPENRPQDAKVILERIDELYKELSTEKIMSSQPGIMNFRSGPSPTDEFQELPKPIGTPKIPLDDRYKSPPPPYRTVYRKKINRYRSYAAVNLAISLAAVLVSLIGLLNSIVQQADVSNHSLSINKTEKPPDNPNTSHLREKSCPAEKDDSLSCGEESLFTGEILPEKKQGIAAFAKGNYNQAISLLEAARKKQPADPETLIYLNNARVAAQDADAYTIAVAVPLDSGLESVNGSGKEILRGVAQAQNEVNQGQKINGKMLRVEIADDGSNVDQAQEIARALVAQDDLLGVVGHFSSGVTNSSVSVYRKDNLVLISPTSTSVELSGSSNFFFRTVSSDRVTARALVDYLGKELRQQKVVVFYNSNSSYSRSLQNQFHTYFSVRGGRVVKNFDFSESGFNASTAVKEAERLGAKVLVLFPNAATRSDAIEVVKANQGRYCMVAGDSVYNAQTLEVGSNAVNRLVVAVPWHRQNSPNPEFPKEAEKLWKGGVSWRTALGYDATMALIAALRKRSQGSRIDVQQALADPDFQTTGATGEVRFQPNGDRQGHIGALTTVVKSGTGHSFVPTDKAYPLDCN